MAEIKEELKSLLMEVKKECEKVVLTTQWEGVGRGEGGGFRMGGMGLPVADSFRCLAELIQYCKF